MNLLTIKDMNVTIQLNGTITGVVGPTESGKTTLLKKLCNRLNNKDVAIDDVNINEYDITFLKNNLVVVLDDNHFNCDYVAEELFFYLNYLGYRIDEATKKIMAIAKYFKLTDILNQQIDLLSINQKMLIKILSFLIINPKIIAIDDLTSYLAEEEQKQLIKYIKDHNITLIAVTTNPEFLLICDDVVVLNNMKAIVCSNIKSILNENSILPYMGLKLPFLVELSQNLILYQLIDKIFTDKRKLVDNLWK